MLEPFLCYILVFLLVALLAPLPTSFLYNQTLDALNMRALALPMSAIAMAIGFVRLREAGGISRVVLGLTCGLLLENVIWCLRGDAPVCLAPSIVLLLASLLDGRLNRLVVQTAVGLLVCQALCGFVLYALRWHQFETPGFGIRLSGFWGTPNATYPIFLILSCVGLAAIEGKEKRLGWAIFPLAAVALILTFCRGGLIGLAVVLAGLAFYRRQNARWLIAGAGLLLLFALTARTAGSVSGLMADKSLVGRTGIWRSNLQKAADSLPFGSGPDTFDKVLRDPPPGVRVVPTDGKNIALDAVIRYGPVGAVLEVGVLLCLVIAAFRALRSGGGRGQPTLAVGLAAAGLLVAGLADVPVFGDSSRFPATFVFMILAGLAVSPSSAKIAED